MNKKVVKTDGRKKNKGAKGLAGRKPIEDKKIPVQVYVKGSHIEAIGGIEIARNLALEAVENAKPKR